MNPSRPLVVHVLPALAAGGAERFVHDIAVRLPAKGFDVHVIAILRGGPLLPLFTASGVPVTILGVRGLFGWKAVRALVAFMTRERPAIVHTHLFGSDVWGRLAARLAGVRAVFSTEHNCNVEHGIVKRALKGWMTSMTTEFIAPTGGVKRYMVSREHIPAKKITVIPNGIDLSRIIMRQPTGFRDVPRLITVGRLDPQKGHRMLLKALAQVKTPWTLEMIGTGSLEGELRALADRLSIAPRIRWAGFRSDVPQRLAESDVFVFPSRSEGFGLALLEAVAAGVPCIASDLEVFHEFLAKDDVVFVPMGDVPAWANAIRAMLAHPHTAIQRACAARERACATGSIDATVDAYARLYRAALR